MQKALNYILSGVVLYLVVVGCGDSSTTGSSKPVITMLGSSPIDVPVDVAYVDAGATASDAEDGDITDDIVTVNSVEVSTPDTYTVTYDVVDSSGLEANQVVRTVNVVENVAPVITLLGTATVDVPLGSTYTDAGATAADAEDGDITGDIVTVNPVDTTIPDTYYVTYNVVDSTGSAAVEVTRTVIVQGGDGPV